MLALGQQLIERHAQCLGQQPQGTFFYAYDEAGHVLGEYDSTGAPLYEVIWLGDTPIGVIRTTFSAATSTYAAATDTVFVDLQRNAANNEFIPAYTQAANFAVGAYMQGADHGMLTMAVMGILYGMKNSNNFSFTQIGEWLEWWGMGWTAAEYGIYPSCR